MMPIANVCQVCGPLQGSALGVAMSPLVATSPSQHSGAAGQRAPAPATDAAGQCAVVVAIPNVPIPPEAAGPPPGANRRWPTIRAASMTRTSPPPATAAIPRGRQRLVVAASSAPWLGGPVTGAYPAGYAAPVWPGTG